MLAKKSLVLKASLYLLVIALSLLASVSLYHYLKPLFEPFASPFLSSFIAVRAAEEKLTANISIAPPLNFTSSTEPLVLKDIPHYLVLNSQTQVVHAAKGEKESISPASFTKLMTTSVALDLLPADQLLTTTRISIDKEPTVLGLKAGEQFTVRDLVRASIATSANDAAATLAEGSGKVYGGSLELFISLMNKKAKLLNMENTQYTNPEGYDHPKQKSTLEDTFKLVHNVQRSYPIILSAAASDREDILVSPYHGGYYLSNWNGLLNIYPGVTGLKIAFTDNAGYSTIITATRGGVSLVAIVSGAKSITERDLAAASLLDFAFQKEGLTPVGITRVELQKRYNVWNELITKTKLESAKKL